MEGTATVVTRDLLDVYQYSRKIPVSAQVMIRALTRLSCEGPLTIELPSKEKYLDESKVQGFMAAVGSGAVMGFIPGSIFPVVGNFLGAILGGIASGLSWYLIKQNNIMNELSKAYTEIVSKEVDIKIVQPTEELLEAAYKFYIDIIEKDEKNYLEEVNDLERAFSCTEEELKLRLIKYTEIESNLGNLRSNIDEICIETGLETYNVYLTTHVSSLMIRRENK